MNNSIIKFAVSVFKDEKPILAELWDYNPKHKEEFFKIIARTLLDDQKLTLMINQSLFAEFSRLDGDEFIAEYNIDSAKKEQRILLSVEQSCALHTDLKLLAESFQDFITDILKIRPNY